MRWLALPVSLLIVSAALAQDPRRDAGAVAKRLEGFAGVVGVSVKDPANPATWRIDFDKDTTSAQRVTAQDVIDNWTDDDWRGAPEKRRADTIVQIEDLLVKRQRCLLWQADDKLRGLLDRQPEIDDITAQIAKLIAVLE